MKYTPHPAWICAFATYTQRVRSDLFWEEHYGRWVVVEAEAISVEVQHPYVCQGHLRKFSVFIYAYRHIRQYLTSY